jgi:hypothetical protein
MQFVRTGKVGEINVSLLGENGYVGIWIFNTGSRGDQGSCGFWSNLWLFQQIPVDRTWRKSSAGPRLLDFVKKCTNSTLRTLTDNLG